MKPYSHIANFWDRFDAAIGGLLSAFPIATPESATLIGNACKIFNDEYTTLIKENTHGY